MQTSLHLSVIWKGKLILNSGSCHVQLLAPVDSPNFKISEFAETNLKNELNLDLECSVDQVVKLSTLALGVVSVESTSSFLQQQISMWDLQKRLGVCFLEHYKLILVPHRKERLLGLILPIHVQTPAVASLQSEHSLHYFQSGMINYDHKLLRGVFVDPGTRQETLQPLSEYLKEPIDEESREILVVDCHDPLLLAIVGRVRSLLQMFPSLESKFIGLSLFVSNELGGTTIATETVSKHLKELKKQNRSNVVGLGQIRMGHCRHRALLYKFLCDQLDLPCLLIRGELNQLPHAWNQVLIGLEEFSIDCTNKPTELIKLEKSNSLEFSKTCFLKLEMHPAQEEEPLGRGAYSQVFKAKSGGYSLALKKCQLLTLDQINTARQEIQMLSRLSHPNIIRYLGHHQTNQSSVSIFLELMSFSCRMLIDQHFVKKEPLSSTSLLVISSGLLSALEYLHSLRIVHRDIKSENLLLGLNQEEVENVKLIDFGTAIELAPNKSYLFDPQKPGTPWYFSPEITSDCIFSVCSDIYAAAIFLKELILLKPLIFWSSPLDPIESNHPLSSIIQSIFESKLPRPSSTSLLNQLFTIF